MSEGTAKSGSPPNGYHPLPAGFACKCVQVWQDGKGNYWCCRPVAVEMLGSDPSKATHAKIASVQPASAALPSEEDVARALIAYFIDHTGFQTVDEDEKKTSVSASYGGIWVDLRVYPMARAILALFAPILAEVERERDEFYRDGLKAEDKWNETEARALAAEAALEKAEGFDFGNGITVESRGDGRWAVNNCGCVLNSDGDWEHEPRPSSRDDDFISRTRFDRDEAFRRAAAIRAQGE